MQTMMTLLLPFIPKAALLDVLLDAHGSTTAMLSNVPGPQQQVKLMGEPIENLNFYALPPIGIYTGIISYNGWVSLGVVTTPQTCADPSKLTRHWALAWQDMQACVLQADKDGTLLARRPPRPFPLESGAWVLFSAVVCGGLAWGWALLLKRLAGAVGVL